MDGFSLALVIPAFNEETTIKDIVQKAREFGTVIVVDDCSSDATKQMAESASAIVVSHQYNMGYDGAINSGFKKAAEMGANYVITLDADGQHDPHLISNLIVKLKEGNELVLGVRDKLPRISEKIFSFYSQYKFGIRDPCCGLKAYSIDMYKNKGCFDSYGSIGTELAFYAVTNHYSFSQIEFKVKERKDSPRFGSLLKANYKIMKALIRATVRFN